MQAYSTGTPPSTAGRAGSVVIGDMTEQDLVNMRRTIYLTVMSSLSFEECAHKIMQLRVPPGSEKEVVTILLECCQEERTYLKYYGLLGARFCVLSRAYQDACDDAFAETYGTCHRLETNKLRNIAKLFAHLIHSDGLPWGEPRFHEIEPRLRASSTLTDYRMAEHCY